MRESLRREYLRALDIPVWLPRAESSAEVIAETAAAAPLESIAVGPGNGATLFVCGQRAQSSARLASDIARVFAEPPVWAWPDESGAGGTVADAVRASLFTGLVVFGQGLAERLLGRECPERLGSATVVVSDDLETLAHSAEARRALWRQLCAGGLVTAP